MKGNVTRPADVKRGKLLRKTSGNPYGALAQLVARDIRIVEVRGSTPLCSTRKPCRSKPARFFHARFSVTHDMQILHSNPWGIPQGFYFALCGPATGFRIKTPISSFGRAQACSGADLAFLSPFVRCAFLPSFNATSSPIK